MKLAALLVVAILAWRVIAGRWPWDRLRGRGADREAALAQRLLGLAPGANRAEIIDAHRRLVVAVHPDRGGTGERVHEANRARDVLLDRASRPK